jgi:nitroreductase
MDVIDAIHSRRSIRSYQSNRKRQPLAAYRRDERCGKVICA